MNSTNNNNNSLNNTVAEKKVCVGGGSAGIAKDHVFELPDDISEEDELVLTNILSAMYAGEMCSSYKIHTIPTGFLIRGSLQNEEGFEIDMDDLHFISCVNLIRIERVALCSCNGKIELVIKVLNNKQRVMITTSCSFTATKKRKYTQLSSSSSE